MTKRLHKFFTMLALLVLFLSGCQFLRISSASSDHELSQVALATKELLEKNLEFSENENIEGYLSTVDSSNHYDTR